MASTPWAPFRAKPLEVEASFHRDEQGRDLVAVRWSFDGQPAHIESMPIDFFNLRFYPVAQVAEKGD